MKLPNQKKLLKTDYDQSVQELVEQLSYPINYNFNQVFNALNNGVTFLDNIDDIIKTVQVTVDTNGIPTSGIQFSSTFVPARPTGALVIDHINLTDSTVYPTGAIMVTYSESNGNIFINHITGLQPNNNYQLTIIFFA